MPKHTARTIALPAVIAAASLVLAGCSAGMFESAPEDTVYCVDQNNTIVDEQKCEEESAASASQPSTGSGSHGVGSALFFYMIGRYSGGLQPGTRLDQNLSTHRFATTDQAARTQAGMPATGPVKNGYSVSTGKPAGFGSKSGGSGNNGGKPGGFGGAGSGHGTGG